MTAFFSPSPWRISHDGSGFETGGPSTGMVTLSYDQIADLLIENKPALEDFLAVLAKASDKKCWLINYLIYKTYTRKTSDPLPP